VLNSLLNLNVVRGPVILTTFALSIALAGYLLARKPTVRWIVTAAVALVAGVGIALLVLWLVNDVYDTFGMQLGIEVALWAIATFAAIALAIVNLWGSRWWRKVVAALGIVSFALAGTLGINAYFGLNPTIGSLVGVSTVKPIAIAKHQPTQSSVPVNKPLWLAWNPPANMPPVGQVGTQVIPNAISGFHSRTAGIYLPPAALVKNAPALPLVILMMGQPGNPDPQFIQHVLDGDAAANRGLAPIVIVADQLGNPAVDPACADSAKYGNAQTFIVQDVVNWARANLNILQTPRSWTIAGYSNGGACALTLAAKYPTIWGNVLDISGEAFPGADHAARALAEIYGGNQAAYDASKPATILARTTYPNSVGIFTVGSNDTFYRPIVKSSYAQATAAGIVSTYYEVPNGGHVLTALMGGLQEGFNVLYPRLDLSRPATWANPITTRMGGRPSLLCLPAVRSC
jgi:enterochelin esterase-like enzyme